MKREIKLTAQIVQLLNEQYTPYAAEIWENFGLAPIKVCAPQYEKKAGAKADAAFISPNKVCLLLENKCFDAALTDRQKFLYLNHFMHFYDNCNLQFLEHKLIFLVNEHSNYGLYLENLFKEDYKIPSKSLKKSHLKNVIQFGNGHIQNNGWISYHFNATYKCNISTPLIISVKVVKVNIKEINALSY